MTFLSTAAAIGRNASVLGLKYCRERTDRKIGFMKKFLRSTIALLIREALRGVLKEVKGTRPCWSDNHWRGL
jgi:hypothetical protein